MRPAALALLLSRHQRHAGRFDCAGVERHGRLATLPIRRLLTTEANLATEQHMKGKGTGAVEIAPRREMPRL
jgi:hypothetical protein